MRGTLFLYCKLLSIPPYPLVRQLCTTVLILIRPGPPRIPVNSTPVRELAWVRNQVDEANKSGDGGTGTVTVTMDAAELGKRLDSIERSAMGPCDAMMEMFQRCVDVVEGGALPEEVVAMLQGVLRGGDGGGGGGGGEAGGVLPSSPRSLSLARSVSPAPGEREGGEGGGSAAGATFTSTSLDAVEAGEVGGEAGGEATQAAQGWVFRASKAVDLDTVKQLLQATDSAPVTILARYGVSGRVQLARSLLFYAQKLTQGDVRGVHSCTRRYVHCSPASTFAHLRAHTHTHTHT